MDVYLQEWTTGDDNFDENPPNATLSVYEPSNQKNVIVVVELLDPVVEGQDLVYRKVLIDGDMPSGGGAAALFIDRIGPGWRCGRRGVGVGARGPSVAGWAGVAVRNCADGNIDC